MHFCEMEWPAILTMSNVLRMQDHRDILQHSYFRLKIECLEAHNEDEDGDPTPEKIRRSDCHRLVSFGGYARSGDIFCDKQSIDIGFKNPSSCQFCSVLDT